MVDSFLKSKFGIGLVSVNIFLFHIETISANGLPVQMGLALHVLIKLPKDMLLALVWMNIHTLKPPKIPVSPIAPLKGDQYLPNYNESATLKRLFCHSIPSLTSIFKKCLYTRLKNLGIQCSIFSFPG